MRVLVIGATGGSGRATVDALVARGHQVTAFVRRRDAMGEAAAHVRVVQGDAARAADVDRAVRDQDAVVVTLGISEHPLAVRLRGSARTPLDVRSRGTRHVIAAMRIHGVKRLAIQSSFGVGETRNRLPWKWRLIFSLLLKPQIADTDEQERLVRGSGLEWVLVQPVGLTDGPAVPAFASTEGQTRSMAIPRQAVGRFLAEAIETMRYAGRSVALSADA